VNREHFANTKVFDLHLIHFQRQTYFRFISFSQVTAKLAGSNVVPFFTASNENAFNSLNYNINIQLSMYCYFLYLICLNIVCVVSPLSCPFFDPAVFFMVL